MRNEVCFEREIGRRVPRRVDYDAGVRVELVGVPTRVIPEEKLVQSRRALGRPVDLEEVAQIAKRQSVGE